MPPAAKAADTTRENPWPLRRLTQNIKIYVDRMSSLWVEGQVVQYNPRPGSRMAFFTLRDTESDTSMTVTAFRMSFLQSVQDLKKASKSSRASSPFFGNAAEA